MRPLTVRQRVFVALSGIFALYVIGAFVAHELAVRQASRARSLVVELQQLSARDATAGDLLNLVRQYHGTIQSGDCGERACSVKVTMDNYWLHLLRLAPLTTLTARVSILGGQGTNIVLDLMVLKDGMGDPIASLIRLPSDHIIERRLSVGFMGTAVPPGRAFGQVAPSASLAQRSVAFDYNVSCLFRLGGCKNAAELVPAWWEIERRKSELQHSD